MSWGYCKEDPNFKGHGSQVTVLSLMKRDMSDGNLCDDK